MAFTVYVDESGAKQYNDKPEAKKFDFGVAVGVIIPDEIADEIRHLIIDKIREIDPTLLDDKDRKIHVADFKDEHKSRIREFIIGIMKEYNLQWTYQAIYAQGFHNFYKNSHYPQKESLHVKLLSFVNTNIWAYVKDRQFQHNDFKIIIDNIDTGIEKKLNQELKEIINFDKSEIRKKKIFDENSRELKDITLTINLSIPEGLLLPEAVEDISIVNVKNDILLLIPDIVSNYLHYYIKKFLNHPVYLSEKETIRGFELFVSVYADDNPICYPRLLEYPAPFWLYLNRLKRYLYRLKCLYF